ncbi:hypothetical protein DQ04_11501010 [Trypanosoma grayi]|uniref:hypothetical protein n=1 Tax=Trypanosoma grayi TaxID=71804 RepID=UPI0004F46627|nr:hypothetical protein DQ04_11501010 [Trypanosoma grayi]KEG06955.1 hypothetical protein DQ04_11501010 [Trypanosoma grayi]
MPRKDRDVWDPPEDLKPVEAPPSAFMQHFQDRAVRVGKDGSNAQLVRMKQTKPIRWSNGKKNDDASAPPPGALAKNALRALPRNRKNVGGIVAPDEVCAREPQQPLRAPHTNGSGNGSNSSNSWGRLYGAQSPSGACNNNRGTRNPPMPVIELSPERNINLRKAAGSEMTYTPSIPLDTPLPDRGMDSPDVLTIEPVQKLKPVGAFPLAYLSPDTVDEVHTLDGLRKPLSRLPPRKITLNSESCMPKPTMAKQSPCTLLKECSDGSKSPRAVQADNGASSERSGDDSNLEAVDDYEDDAPEIPLYQPIGLFLHPPSTAPKGRCKPSAKAKKPTATGVMRPSSDDGPCSRNRKVSTGRSLRNAMSNSAPLSGSAPQPPRLRPLPQIQAMGTSTTSSTAGTDTRENEDETGKKKPIKYKSHGLKDYKIMMEQVANQKLGGLGPADTDEQRQARERMQRQRQYGQQVEKQASEMIREKLQQQQQPNSGRGTATSDSPGSIQQPPPPERIQAQERRARALEYARNLPRPEPSAGKRPHDDDDSPSSEGRAMRWRTPQDEAAWLREKRLVELETKHRIDRERVAAVKRQLGY